MYITHENNYTLVSYGASRLDSGAAPLFQKTLQEQVVKKTPKAVILDLHDVEFIDSSGLSAIVSVFQALHTKSELLVCGIGEQADKMFRSTKLDTIFARHQNSDSAIKALQCSKGVHACTCSTNFGSVFPMHSTSR